MAIIKLGELVSGIRGTIDGTTYSANKSGTYAKGWARPPLQRTPRQTHQRAIVALLSKYWKECSAGQKTDWDTFAADPAQILINSLGEPYAASGYNWFVKCNTRLIRMGIAINLDAPTIARPAAPTITLFNVTTGAVETNYSTSGVPQSSSDNGAQLAALAFDQNPSTYWESANVPAPNEWIKFQKFIPAVPWKKTVITCQAGTTNGNPKDFVISFYDPGGPGWTALGTFTNFDWGSGTQTFYFPNTIASQQIRLLCTAAWGAARVRVNEIYFYLGDTDASIITYPEGEFVDSPGLHLVAHIATARSEGLAEKYAQFYEIVLNSLPNFSSQPIQTELQTVFGTISQYQSFYLRLFRQTEEGVRSAPATA